MVKIFTFSALGKKVTESLPRRRIQTIAKRIGEQFVCRSVDERSVYFARGDDKSREIEFVRRGRVSARVSWPLTRGPESLLFV